MPRKGKRRPDPGFGFIDSDSGGSTAKNARKRKRSKRPRRDDKPKGKNRAAGKAMAAQKTLDMDEDEVSQPREGVMTDDHDDEDRQPQEAMAAQRTLNMNLHKDEDEVSQPREGILNSPRKATPAEQLCFGAIDGLLALRGRPCIPDDFLTDVNDGCPSLDRMMEIFDERGISLREFLELCSESSVDTIGPMRKQLREEMLADTLTDFAESQASYIELMTNQGGLPNGLAELMWDLYGRNKAEPQTAANELSNGQKRLENAENMVKEFVWRTFGAVRVRV
jgi:hypothetical protein